MLYSRELRTVLKVFLIGVLLGIIYTNLSFQNSDQFLKFVTPFFADILNQPKDFGSIFISIFHRNLSAVLIIIFLGVIYRYLPFIPLFFNGFLLGMFIYAVIVFLHQAFQLLKLFPHGIFEIPALLLSVAMATKLSTISKPKNIWGRVKALVKIRDQIALIIFLLLVAGVIETSSILFF